MILIFSLSLLILLRKHIFHPEQLSYNKFASTKLKGVTFDSFFLPATPEDKGELEEIILASYGFSVPWLKKHVPKDCPVTLIGREEYLVSPLSLQPLSGS